MAPPSPAPVSTHFNSTCTHQRVCATVRIRIVCASGSSRTQWRMADTRQQRQLRRCDALRCQLTRLILEHFYDFQQSSHAYTGGGGRGFMHMLYRFFHKFKLCLCCVKLMKAQRQTTQRSFNELLQ